MTFDPYRILAIDRGASHDQIRQAYLDLARKYHPDMNDSKEAEDYFKLIDTAYSILSNPEKRQLFDEHGEAAIRLNFDPAQLQIAKARQVPRDSDGLSTFLGGAKRTSHSREPVGKADLVIPVEVDAGIASSGGTVRFSSPVGGAILAVKIPPGSRTGSRIRMVGKGKAGGKGGRPGDLYLELTVRGAGGT